MKQTIRIFRLVATIAATALLHSCQETVEISDIERMGIPVPEGEIPFTLRMGSVGDAETRGELFGETSSTLTNKAIQMLCFDESGFFIGIRQAYIGTSNNGSTPGTFSGYVPDKTARIHFVANLGLPEDFPFPVGTSENVIMQSQALSTGFQDVDPQNQSIQSVKFWGYKRCENSYDMWEWLTQGQTKTVMLLRDRARITLTIPSEVVSQFAGIEWTVFNGRDRGYVAPYDPNYEDHQDSDPWSGYYPSNHYYMTEYKESQRYTVSNSSSYPNGPFTNYDVPQYVFDDSNVKDASGEDGRIRVLLKVTPKGTGATPKYILLLLRDEDGEQMQITRNKTYNIVVTGLAAKGYSNLEDAIDPDANDFGNAPPEVDPSVPVVSDGQYTLELLNPGSVVIVRNTDESEIHVSFKFTTTNQADPYASTDDATALEDFFIGWQDNDQTDWTYSTPSHTNTTNGLWEMDLNIGTIGDTYAFEDYLVIRHRESGLYRTVHVYAVDAFQYRTNPSLQQVLISESPYMGPSGDEIKRPVFALRFKLPESLDTDMFPITVRFASSTLEPYGDNFTTYTSRQDGKFAVQNTSTSQSADGTPLAHGGQPSDWNYQSDSWNFWYCYTVNEYPEDGEVVSYFKDDRDARAQASTQDVGLYLDIDNFTPAGLYIDADDVKYPTYGYGTDNGEYTVSWQAARYRFSLSGCAAGTYTLSEAASINDSEATELTWLEDSASPLTVTQDGGKIDVIFSVHENGTTPREGVIVLTNETTGTQTKVKIIQEAGPNASISLRAENLTVRGDVEEVKIIVMSTGAWTLRSQEGDGGCFAQLGATTATATISGSETGSGGYTVRLIMPVNYSTEDKDYVLTAYNSDAGQSAQITVTQRGGTLSTGRTVRFLADDFRRTYTNASNNNPAIDASYSKDNCMTATFDRLYGYTQGFANSDFNRFDVTYGNDDTATLTFTIEKQVARITAIQFVYHHEVFHYAPDSPTSSIGGTFSDYSRTLGSSNLYQTWTAPNHDPADTEIVFTLTNTSRVISFKAFTVTYDKIIWK